MADRHTVTSDATAVQCFRFRVSNGLLDKVDDSDRGRSVLSAGGADRLDRRCLTCSGPLPRVSGAAGLGGARRRSRTSFGFGSM